MSERLSVELVSDVSSISEVDVIDILSNKATEYLPLDWQGVSNTNQAKAWITQRIAGGGFHQVIHRYDSQLVGFLFLYGFKQKSINTEIRIGYILAESFWGKGLATELIQNLVNYYQRQPNVFAIIGGVVPDNIASVKVLTNNGFKLTKKTENTEFYEYRIER